MPGLQQIQDMLERTLGTYPMPAHNYFWRGKTRDELVATTVFGMSMLVPGRPADSYLLRAMRDQDDGNDPSGVARLHKIFADVGVAAEDVDVLDAWIRQGCPEIDPLRPAKAVSAGTRAFAATAAANDDIHVRYWRAIDDFFLPNLASPVTQPHVLRVVVFDSEWVPTVAAGGDLSQWLAFLADPQNLASFNYIRHHQRRLIQEYYGSSKDDLLDSLWKFGGNLLPVDPESHALPNHTMNGVGDWFSWSPYIDASLRAPDLQAIDVNLARSWQIGLVADGLLRTDADRPVGQRMPIGDFTAGDPDLRVKVLAKYAAADPATLIAEMVRRARESELFGLPIV